jgi:hypothetical protein
MSERQLAQTVKTVRSHFSGATRNATVGCEPAPANEPSQRLIIISPKIVFDSRQAASRRGFQLSSR